MNADKLIDKKRIGFVNFEAYIIVDENNLLAFAVYFDGHSSPIVLFQQNIPNEKVEISINRELVERLQQIKSKSESLRKKHYKEFKSFVLEAEQKAKELVFKDKRIRYISDVNAIKDIEKIYLNEGYINNTKSST